MLSNKAWLLKFLIPVGLFAGLSLDSVIRLGTVRPCLPDCMRDPERHDGRRVWAGPRRVEEIRNDGFFQKVDGKIVRIRWSKTQPPVGKHVAVRGIFRKPDILEADDVREEANWHLERYGGVYGISSVVLLGWLWYFLKRFRLGVRGGLFHPRDDAPPGDPPPPATGNV